jgi:hypothetical protein
VKSGVSRRRVRLGLGAGTRFFGGEALAHSGVGSSEIGDRRSEIGDRRSEIGVRSSEFGARSSEIGVRSSEFGDRSSEFGVRSSEFGVRSSEIGVRRSEFGFWIFDWGLAGAAHRQRLLRKMANPKCSIPNPQSVRWIGKGVAPVRGGRCPLRILDF